MPLRNLLQADGTITAVHTPPHNKVDAKLIASSYKNTLYALAYLKDTARQDQLEAIKTIETFIKTR